ncbi:MAG: flavin reductase family protein [Methanobacteriota archaeon]
MDAAKRRKALRMIPYGLYCVTTHDGAGKSWGYLGTWLSQASFDPPLVMIAVRRDSHTLPMMRASTVFAVNFLAKGQEPVVQALLKGWDHAVAAWGADAVTTGKTGAPLLRAAQGHIECRLIHESLGGDHAVLVAEVIEAEHHGKADHSLLHRDMGLNYGG